MTLVQFPDANFNLKSFVDKIHKIYSEWVEWSVYKICTIQSSCNILLSYVCPSMLESVTGEFIKYIVFFLISMKTDVAI